MNISYVSPATECRTLCFVQGPIWKLNFRANGNFNASEQRSFTCNFILCVCIISTLYSITKTFATQSYPKIRLKRSRSNGLVALRASIRLDMQIFSKKEKKSLSANISTEKRSPRGSLQLITRAYSLGRNLEPRGATVRAYTAGICNLLLVTAKPWGSRGSRDALSMHFLFLKLHSRSRGPNRNAPR